jgi:hypothetical protein
MTSKDKVLTRVKEGLIGQRSIAILNLEILINNPTAIPEHVNYYDEIDKLIGEVAEIDDKLNVVNTMIEKH